MSRQQKNRRRRGRPHRALFPLRVHDRLALPARPPRRGGRQRDDLDQPRRRHARGDGAGGDDGRQGGRPGRVRRHDPRPPRPCRGVARGAPVIRGQAMVTANERSNVAEVYGITPEDLKAIPRVAGSEDSLGDIDRFGEGIAIGSGIARELGLGPGDVVKLIQPSGARTAFGTSPRVNAYEVVYVFTAGRWDIDRTRIYMPYA